jgi:hypothetical protein
MGTVRWVRGPRKTIASPGPARCSPSRAARWATIQVGRHARSVNEVATELGCDWHTVNHTVVAYGEALLDADEERIGEVSALGLEATPRRRPWSRECRAHGLVGRADERVP